MARPNFTGPTGPDYISLAGASGAYTTQYLNAFATYGTEVELVFYDANASGNGAVPDYTDYASGVATNVKAFIDLDMPQALIGEKNDVSVLGATNLRGTARQIRTGTGYFPPNHTFTDATGIFVLTGNVTFGDIAGLSTAIHDVWEVTYAHKRWHIFKPLPLTFQDQILCYKANLIEVGLNYDPFTLAYDRITSDPLDNSKWFPGQVGAGYHWPMYGIDYV